MRKNIKKIFTIFSLSAICIGSFSKIDDASAANNFVYPLKQVSKLECRFQKFSDLSSDCKEDLPILHTRDYKKYANENGGYNKFTRIYTVLWGASYKYGWDQGYGGHMGVDIATAEGTPIYAMGDGKVINAHSMPGTGKTVSIEHNINGKVIVSNYGHMSKILVSKGQTVSAGDLIGEVGTTGNSTGNHLHFQIDTYTRFSPIYYSRKTCPYSYYEITEKGVCFNELQKITLDPLKFLETNGAILNDIEIQAVEKIDPVDTTSSSQSTSKKLKKAVAEADIFTKTVYIGYAESDVKKVQKIYKKIGYYDGYVSGDYNDILEDVIRYQLDKNIISSRSEAGAGRFGPKTRAQTQKDWIKQISLDAGIIMDEENSNIEHIEGRVDTYVSGNKVNIQTDKIERKNMLTREEIEAREVEDFLKSYNIDLQLVNPGGTIEKGKTEILKLSITDRRGRAFKGNMPGFMNFIVNTDIVSIFPEKLFVFTDGKRDIELKGLKDGNTDLYVKVGIKTIKKIKLKVYSSNKDIYPDSAKLFTPRRAVIGEGTRGLAAFKDEQKKFLINMEFGSNYTLRASKGNQVCIKRGNIKNIKRIYLSKCSEDDYKNEIVFDYSDTVGGVLVFDLKTLNNNATYEIINNYNQEKLDTKDVAISNPKGLTNTYVYKDEIIKTLEKGITSSGMKQGYFMEQRKLTELDAYTWIKKTLLTMKQNSNNETEKYQIERNIQDVRKLERTASRTKGITRLEFLALNYKYLLNGIKNNNITIVYKDLSPEQNQLVNTIFSKDNTWKDQFGGTYFRPDEPMTRGEGAFLLAGAIKHSNNNLVTLK